MALTIIKKKNNIVKKELRRAVITILGTLNTNEAEYISDKTLEGFLCLGGYKNMFPLILDTYANDDATTIIPLYTSVSHDIQSIVVKDKEIDIKEHGHEIDDKNFDSIFNTINEILSDEQYTEFIIDISHGFRHLPILATISMMINNFQDATKIKHILFAKELESRIKYEIIDLKSYLEIANISFVLNTFNDNYTVAHHIKSIKYSNLISALNNFSNDIMALNLSNLNNNSLPNLTNELSLIEDISIKTLAQGLKTNLEKDFRLEDKRYLTFYKLSKNLFEKNYILPSLSMLYESIRMYIKTAIKKDRKAIVIKIENHFNDDLYKIGDFFKNIEWKRYDDLKEKNIISLFEYDKLRDSFNRRMTTPGLMKDISNTRNDLSHANAKSTFQEIQNITSGYIKRYNELYKLDEKLI